MDLAKDTTREPVMGGKRGAEDGGVEKEWLQTRHYSVDKNKGGQEQKQGQRRRLGGTFMHMAATKMTRHLMCSNFSAGGFLEPMPASCA